MRHTYQCKAAFLSEGLSEDVLADLACQMLHVYRIPAKLDAILRSKSNGVPSWCEQVIKELEMTNILQVCHFVIIHEILNFASDTHAFVRCSKPK